MKVSFFSPKTQFENVGDALINREMIELASLNSRVILDLSRCPAEFNETLGLNDNEKVEKVNFGFLNLFFSMVLNRILLRECFYFLSPGGYFGEVEKLDYFKRIMNSLVLFILHIIGVKICHFGVSYERLGPNFSKVIKYRSLFLHSHVVRDKLSYDYANSLGIKVSGVCPDLAYNLFSPEEKLKAEGKVICFSFRVDQHPRQKDLVKNIITELDKSYSDDYKFIFYSQVTRDSEYMKDLAQETSKNTERNVEFIEIIGDINKTMSFFQSVDYVLSNRLHVLLMSGGCGCNIVACSFKRFNTKVQGIMASYSDTGVYDMSYCNPELLNNLLLNKIKLNEFGLKEKSKLRDGFKSIYEVNA
jgi:polysaccharide pyruvyl transferase WcaK-like protein